MNSAISNAKAMASSANSKDENVSEIQSLTADAQRLGDSVQFWTVLSLIFVIGTAIAAVGYGVTSLILSKRQKLLSVAQSQMIKAKDEQLVRDLKAKDVEIEKAKGAAGKANERAGQLEKEAAELTANNLRLEAAIAPRRLSPRQQHDLASLTTFSNRKVGIKSYANDVEGLVVASQIFDALSKAGISIEDNRLTMQPAGSISFGISVEGTDETLVEELRRILSSEGNLAGASTVSLSQSRGGVSVSVAFGAIRGAPVAASIVVGVKPIK